MQKIERKMRILKNIHEFDDAKQHTRLREAEQWSTCAKITNFVECSNPCSSVQQSGQHNAKRPKTCGSSNAVSSDCEFVLLQDLHFAFKESKIPKIRVTLQNLYLRIVKQKIIIIICKMKIEK